jgi:hypothetical protein
MSLSFMQSSPVRRIDADEPERARFDFEQETFGL